jgi:hypothetical protein
MDTIAAGSRLTLHLGVIVQQYRTPSTTGRGRKKRRTVKATDTGQVAGWLEDKYGLFTVFWNVYGQRGADALADGLAGHLENMLMGAPTGNDPFGQGCSQIDEFFRNFIASKESENVGIPGTPTMAAIRGVNHRLKHPYAKSNPRRPSFLDTGILMGSYRTWMTSGN